MTPATTETTARTTGSSIRDRVTDATRRAVDISHEAQRLKSLAADAIEDGAYAAKRAIKSARHRVDQLEDIKDEAVHRVKRHPLKAVAFAAGVGLVLGMVVGWFGGRFGKAKATGSD
jgi:ElaB/YqjD/DUF883 family membrane-anchored ribosome-binding protein